MYGIPIQDLNGCPNESLDCVETESSFLQSLLWDQDRVTNVPLLSMNGLIPTKRPTLSEKNLGRKKGMPTWSWVSCKSHDVNILGSPISNYEGHDNVCYSPTVFTKDVAAKVQVVPRIGTYTSSILPEFTTLLTFENAYVVNKIDPRLLFLHFSNMIYAKHFDSRFYDPQFETLDGIPTFKALCDGKNPTFVHDLVLAYIDRETGTDMAAIKAGMATLGAILLEVRSNERVIMKDDLLCSIGEGETSSESKFGTILHYNFLLVCQRESKPATRLGVLQLTCRTKLYLINPDAFSRGCITLA